MNYFNDNDIELNVIDYAFPNALKDEIILLKTYVMKIINYLANKFNFTEKEIYVQQFKKNNGRDIMSIVLMLLPYIDTMDLKKLVSFNQLFSNISNRQIDAPLNISISEYLKENYNLLIRSINIISNKLYINWITTFPIKIDEIENLITYKQLNSWILNHTSESGLYIGDVYNTLVNDLYINIKPYKWLLYEVYENGTIISFEEIFNEINSWNDILLFLQTNINPFKYSNNTVINLLRYMLIFFENYYPINKLENYKPLTNTNLLELEEDKTDDIKIDDITSEIILSKLYLIGVELWENYIADIKRNFN